MSDKLQSVVHSDENEEIVSALRVLAARSGPTAERLRRSLAFIESSSRAGLPRRDLKVSDLSSVLLQVGFESPDGSAIVGRDGHLFLYRGNNDLIGAYQPERAPRQRLQAQQWIELLANREERAQALGIQFLQVMVPESASILTDKFPVKISAPTVVMGEVDRAMASNPAYISGYDALRQKHGLPVVFRKVDSHLSPTGAWLIFREILKRLGHPDLADPVFEHGEVLIGDLSLRLLGFPIYEAIPYPAKAFTAPYEAYLVQTELHHSPSGHNGSYAHFKNDSAPIDKKVIVFGNSFFEFGRKPMALTWWAARWFREFQFIWSPNIDFDYVQKERPDILIGQTIERFLPRVASE